MKMTVMKEEVFHNQWFLETRGKAQHAGPHGEAPGSVIRWSEGKMWARACAVVSVGRIGEAG